MPFDVASLADAVEMAVRTALAPIGARLRALEAKTVDQAPISLLGERVAELEARPVNPEPAGPDERIRFDSYRVEYDGERTFTHTWSQGTKTVAIPFVTPLAIYRGTFIDGKLYERGDLVTVNGSIYHCNTDTKTRPGNGGKEWTLAVKRGRDDRDHGVRP